MKRTIMGTSGVVTISCVIASLLVAVAVAENASSPVFGVQIPPGYRDWAVISVAHEAGKNNDIRAIVGNDIAMKAFRDGTRPFPDGAIIGRMAWEYLPSAENDAIFGQAQSFVAGPATNVQFSVKDTKKYPDTDGWGFGQFENGMPNSSEALVKTCFPCHARGNKADDFVFTHYAP